MPKKLLSDIRISKSPHSATHAAHSLPHEVPFEPTPSRRSSRYGLWYVAVIAIIGFLFSLSFLFERATVTITPKSASAAFDSTDIFTAHKDSTADDTIAYTEMTLVANESLKIPATDTKVQSLPAKGSVVLYNTYTAAPYKLVKSTRLETTDGKIYRLDTAAVIPGYKKSGTEMIPGTVEVNVTADALGEASNIDQADFTLPGLAGSAQALKIYGRTKGPITGGISGTVYSISGDAASAAYGTLRNKLRLSLIAKARAEVPKGYDFFPDATVFRPDDAVVVPYSKTKDIPLALHGTLTAYLIKDDTLVKAIAEKFISQYNNEPVTIPKLSSLSIVPAAAMAPDTDTSFNFSFSGMASIVWKIDPVAVQKALAGSKKADFEKILGSMQGIEKADVVLKPFWKRSFPADPTRITVTVTGA